MVFSAFPAPVMANELNSSYNISQIVDTGHLGDVNDAHAGYLEGEIDSRAPVVMGTLLLEAKNVLGTGRAVTLVRSTAATATFTNGLRSVSFVRQGTTTIWSAGSGVTSRLFNILNPWG